MSLVVTGLSHHTSDVALREKMAFSEESVPAALLGLRKHVENAGAVILSTCNRSEIYVNHAGDATDLHHDIRGFLCDWHKLPEAQFRDALYEYRDAETVGHLFRVTSSLDSLVVGEGQILGQVHEAYQLAQTEQTTDKIIHELFQKAFTVAKRVRTHSNISVGKVSISSVAVDLAVSIFMDLSGKTVMVIGSGEMRDLTLKSLIERGVGKILVANRDADKARRLAETYNGEAVALNDIDLNLHKADIVISSTAAQNVVLQKKHFHRALKERSQRPMFVIDIAMPRDVEASANELDNVYLYDIDDLQQVADDNLQSRRGEVDKCLEIVESGVNQYWKWYKSLVAEPTIVSLAAELNAVREQELAKTLAALPNLDDKQKEEITYLTKRIVNNLLQRPLAQIKQEAHREDHLTVLQLVRRIFGLKEIT